MFCISDAKFGDWGREGAGSVALKKNQRLHYSYIQKGRMELKISQFNLSRLRFYNLFFNYNIAHRN